MDERGWTPISRAVLSGVAMAFGWGVGFLYYAAYMVYFSPAGQLSAVEPGMLRATARYITLSWLLFVLPLAMFAKPRWRFLYWPLSPLFGAVYGPVALIVLLGWPDWRTPQLLIHAAVVGGVAGLIYGIGVLVPLAGARHT